MKFFKNKKNHTRHCPTVPPVAATPSLHRPPPPRSSAATPPPSPHSFGHHGCTCTPPILVPIDSATPRPTTLWTRERERERERERWRERDRVERERGIKSYCRGRGGCTTRVTGFAESEILSVQRQFSSAEPVPRGSSRHSALGTVWPAKCSLPRARSRTHGTWVL
jgi:hypothetical protein